MKCNFCKSEITGLVCFILTEPCCKSCFIIQKRLNLNLSRMVQCKYCSKEFCANSTHRRYCSDACRDANQLKQSEVINNEKHKTQLNTTN